jgi:hypothetical protein
MGSEGTCDGRGSGRNPYPKLRVTTKPNASRYLGRRARTINEDASNPSPVVPRPACGGAMLTPPAAALLTGNRSRGWRTVFASLPPVCPFFASDGSEHLPTTIALLGLHERRRFVFSASGFRP